MNIKHELIELLYLNELELPRKKIELDDIISRKLEKQEAIELRFIGKFFKIIDKFVPYDKNTEEEFIGRYNHYIVDQKTKPYFGTDIKDINISEIFDFINRLGIESEYTKVARTLGFLSKRSTKSLTNKDKRKIETLKSILVNDLLNPVKRIMRGTHSDKTHSGVAHPMDIKKRYDAWRIKSIQRKWDARKLLRDGT